MHNCDCHPHYISVAWSNFQSFYKKLIHIVWFCLGRLTLKFLDKLNSHSFHPPLGVTLTGSAIIIGNFSN